MINIPARSRFLQCCESTSNAGILGQRKHISAMSSLCLFPLSCWGTIFLGRIISEGLCTLASISTRAPIALAVEIIPNLRLRNKSSNCILR